MHWQMKRSSPPKPFRIAAAVVVVVAVLGLIQALPHSGSTGATSSSSVAELNAELRAAEARVVELQRWLQEAARSGTTTHATVTDDEHIAAIPETGSCAPPTEEGLNLTLPPGSYNNTCINCMRWSESVQCECLPRDGVDPSRVPLAPGNLSGLWAGDNGMQLRLQTLPSDEAGGVAFRVVCAWGALDFNGGYYDSGCTSHQQPRIVDPKRVPSWYGGNGTVFSNHSAVLHLDNGEVVHGSFSSTTASSFLWPALRRHTHGQNHSVPARTWIREPHSGRIVTSLSLSTCQNFSSSGNADGGGHVLLSNEDGHLFCEWKRTPPPRIGRLINQPVGPGGPRDDYSFAGCRVLDHISFVAPQFKERGDPLLVQPSLNLSTLRNITGTLANISGSWTSFVDDGEMQIMQV